MYLRIAAKKKDGKEYKSLHLVESYRDGDKVRQRIIANFGSIERFTQRDIDNIFEGLCRIFGRSKPTEEVARVDQALQYGEIHAIWQMWKQAGWAEIIKERAKKSALEFDVEKLLLAMVANRLSDLCSKLGILEWLEGVHIPGVEKSRVQYHQLLRAMDWLIENKAELEKRFSEAVVGLFTRPLSVVFYDCTSVYFQTERGGEFITWGHSRDKRSDLPQVVLGLVCVPEGIPVAHYVFSGNTADRTTFKQVMEDLRVRWGVERCVVVADRGMLSEQNLQHLSRDGFGYVMSIGMKQNAKFQKLLPGIKRELERKWTGRGEAKEVYAEREMAGKRLVVAYSGHRAEQSRQLRERLCNESEEEIYGWIGKLNAQDRGSRTRGRRLTDQGVLLKAHELLLRKGIRSYYKLFLDEDGLIRVHRDRKVFNRARRLDGVLAVITTERDLPAQQLVEQYKDLQDVERGFRTLKSSIDIRPMYHWTERRIRGHVFLCVMALQLERLMRHRLKESNSELSVQGALRKLSRIHALKTGRHMGLTALQPEQRKIYRQLELPFPRVEHLSGKGV